jgi:hypothetical protein
LIDPSDDRTVWRHPLGMFPPVIVDADRIGLGIRCESLDACLAALPAALELLLGGDDEVSGARGAPFRQATLNVQGGVELWIV